MRRVVRRFIAACAGIILLGFPAACEQALSPAQRAKAAFDKVDTSGRPALEDTRLCTQAQAALLAVSRPEDRFLIHYRMGYCALFGALVTNASSDYQEAAQQFELSIQTWPRKRKVVSSGLRAIRAIARLEGGRAANAPNIELELAAAITQPDCSATDLMQPSFCTALVDTARLWLAWLNIQANKLEEAARRLEPLKNFSWNAWLAGRQAFEQKQWADVIPAYEKAVRGWSAAEKSPAPQVADLLGPQPDLARSYYELGLAQYAAGNSNEAIKSLDAALERKKDDSNALFWRARAKEALNQMDLALADYESAVKLVNRQRDGTWQPGEAHYYYARLLFRDKNYRRAEEEFDRALRANLGSIRKNDVNPWRHMAAAARGACEPSADLLEASLKEASSQFPRADAEALLSGCRLAQAKTLEQLLAVAQKYRGHLSASQDNDLRMRIAEAYANQGVAAEDQKNTAAAMAAYRNALEWDPLNSKARFNLGAIYIEQKRYNLAEGEYRALVKAHPTDYEAQYWLAQCIFAQKPAAARRDEACAWLGNSLSINDPEKRKRFSQALALARCKQ